MIKQFEIKLPAYPKGFHLITKMVNDRISELPDSGLVHILLKHTSAGITLNENADPSVRTDFESFMNKLIPENDPAYTHVFEGADDMPAHLKSSLIGQTLMIPVTNGHLNLGTWQGIYLCEFRNHGGPRRLVITIYS